MIEELVRLVAAWPTVVQGTVAGIFAGLLTGVGALPVLFGGRLGPKSQNALLGFAAGVMLAATAFSLVLPGLDHGTVVYGSAAWSAMAAAAGILVGGLAVAALHAVVPHEHFVTGRDGSDSAQLRRLWLFVFAIALHNFPEGLAVGVGFGGGDVANGLSLALGIGLQNMPEGLAVAVALLSVGYTPARALLIAAATGLLEALGGLVGAGAVTLAAPLLPFGLTFAAGAMLFVISNEIIPETHRKGHAAQATGGLMIGFVVMMQLDVLFG